MEFRIQEKVAIVTGAASKKGIGNAVARALAAEGAKVVVTDIADGIEELATEIEGLAIKADQSKYEQVQAAVAQVKEKYGRIDILVNCAALTSNFGSLSKMDPARWDLEVNVNLNGPYYWTREVLPVMTENGFGRIINISSVAGSFGTTGLPCYAVTKGGVHLLTKQTARENAHKGITANCLVLGIIATEIYERGGVDQATLDRLVNNIPIKRMGQPDEIANLATFLCSEQASYVTGAVIPVDGALSVSI